MFGVSIDILHTRLGLGLGLGLRLRLRLWLHTAPQQENQLTRRGHLTCQRSIISFSYSSSLRGVYISCDT
eukprot:COSAG06_NODE_45224_length_356_cov_1.202335_1_plen_69_part_01